MSEILLIMINFIVIMGLTKLGISKYSKYKINKLAFNQCWKSRQLECNHVVIGLNLIFLFLLAYLESDSLTMIISTSIMAIIDIITVIRVGAFSRFKNDLSK